MNTNSMKKGRKALALVLALLIAIGMTPGIVFADPTESLAASSDDMVTEQAEVSEDAAAIDEEAEAEEATAGEVASADGKEAAETPSSAEEAAEESEETPAESTSRFSTMSMELMEEDSEPPVAQIDEVNYSSLKAAIEAASDGQTVKLLGDASMGQVQISKTIKIDLGEKTLTLTAAQALQAVSGGDVTISNGTIISSSDDIISAMGGKITLGSGLAISCSSSIIYSYNGGSVVVDGATLTSTSTVYVACYVEGSTSTMELKSGEISSSGNNPAAAKSGGVFTISGGLLKSIGTNAYPPAYSAYGGKIVVSGGSVEGPNGYALIAASQGLIEVSGGTISGAAGILVHENAASKATVTGGTLTGDGYAVYSKLGSTAITGGTLNGSIGTGDGGTLTVSGGSFDREPDAKYFATGYSLYSTDTGYSVDPSGKVAKIGTNYYDSIEAAIAAATDGQTVKLLVGTSTSGISVSKEVNIDLQGHRLTVSNPEGVKAVSGGKLSIVSGTIETASYDIISANGGEITLGEDLAVSGNSSLLYAYNGGNITIDGATLTSTNPNYTVAYVTGTGSSIIVGSGSLSSNGTNHVTLSADNGASATINGGTVSNDASTVVVAKGAGSTVTINGGTVATIAKDMVAGYSVNGGKIIVNGGTVDSVNWCALSAITFGTASGGSVEVNGGTINKAVGAYEATSSSLKITGGTIGDEDGCGVYINNGARGTIEGGTIKGYASVDGEGTGNLTISGGNFTNKVNPEYIVEGKISTAAADTDGYYAVKDARTITFANDDDTELQKVVLADGETPQYTGETPTKASTVQYNYAFVGWNPALAAATEDTTYKARYSATPVQYPISWYNEDGTLIQTTYVAYGSRPTNTVNKTATAEYAYDLVGWATEKGGTAISKNSLPEVTGPASYYAVFTSGKRTYHVSFENDKTVLQSGYIAYGETPSYTGDTPAKAATAQYSYTFKGWDKEIVPVTGTTTYKATFTVSPKKYTVIFADENGVGLQKSEVAYGETPTYTGETPTKASAGQNSYTFAGWTPEITTVTGEATYTATYTTGPRKYAVKFVNDDGTVLQSNEVEYDVVPIYEGDTPTKEATAQYSYTFAGWDKDIVSATSDATYTAIYDSSVNSYIVTFVDEDGITVLKEVATYEYGTAADDIEKPDTPTKASDASYNYSFAGWTPELAMVAADVTYVATYTATAIQSTGGGSGGGGGGGGSSAPSTVVNVPASSGEETISLEDEAVPLADADSVLGTSANENFTDVPATEWYHDAVYFAVEAGLFTGKNATTFDPKGNATREQVMTVLARLSGLTNATIAEGTSWAVDKGISDGKNPKANITREQFVTMLYRLAGSPATSTDSLDNFSDGLDVSSWAQPAMAWAIDNGVVTGYQNSTVRGAREITRAELAAMMQRVLEKELIKEEPVNAAEQNAADEAAANAQESDEAAATDQVAKEEEGNAGANDL